MGARGGGLATVALTCSLGACGLTVTGAATNDTPTAPDGGIGAAPIFDAALPPDADGATSPGTRFCASSSSPTTFCADFDTESPNVADGWDSMIGAARRTTSFWASAPAALEAVSDAGRPTLLVKAFEVNASITVDLDVRYAAIPGAPGALTPFIIQPSNDGGGYFYLYAEPGRSYLQVADDEYSLWQAPEPAAGVWHHITASVTIEAARTTFTGSLDGVAYTWPSAPSKHPWMAGTKVTVEVGVAPYQANGAIAVDNVVVNVR